MTHDGLGVYFAGVAIAMCSCGWEERLEHGTRAMAQTLADEHARLAPIHAELTPTVPAGPW